MRGLEHPLLDRLDDDGRTAQGDEGNFRILRDRHDRHGLAGERAADQHVDRVVVDQLARERHRLLGIGSGIVKRELELAAEHAALPVDPLDVELEGFGFGIAEERPRPAGGDEAADPDRLGRARGLRAP